MMYAKFGARKENVKYLLRSSVRECHLAFSMVLSPSVLTDIRINISYRNLMFSSEIMLSSLRSGSMASTIATLRYILYVPP